MELGSWGAVGGKPFLPGNRMLLRTTLKNANLASVHADQSSVGRNQIKVKHACTLG